jgi:Niemann-Pick C1 protein
VPRHERARHVLVFKSLSAPSPRPAQDVVYPVMNERAMTYVGGGARDGQAWLDFLGTIKDARSPPAGSPFQIDFPAAPAPAGMAALAGALPACWDAALRCSCGDCPDGPQCAPVRGPVRAAHAAAPMREHRVCLPCQ